MKLYEPLLIGTVLAIFVGACSEAKRIGRQQARAEKERQEETELLRKTRERFPCDTVLSTTHTDTIYQYVQGAAIGNPAATFAFRVDTVRQVRTVEKLRVTVDSARAQELRLTIESLKYQGQLLREKYDILSDEAFQLGQELKEKQAEYQETKTKLRQFQWIIGAVVVGLILSAGLIIFLRIKTGL